ncbi:hypothetical protein MMC12_005975 [Toensbergia leucococca]|nr:hypothetical protein [Toensbergia leucococca]
MANEVSPQSCFWAVVALGLNSFVQPAGIICGLSSSPIFRTCPLLSLFNAIAILVELVSLCSLGYAPRKAARLVMSKRSHASSSSPLVTNAVIGDKAPSRTWWLRLAVFVFGALPQMVKVIGFEGVPLTQTICAAFFVSFLVVEVVALAAEHPIQSNETEWTSVARQTDSMVQRISAYFGLLAIIIQLLTYGWIGTYIWDCKFSERDPTSKQDLYAWDPPFITPNNCAWTRLSLNWLRQGAVMICLIGVTILGITLLILLISRCYPGVLRFTGPVGFLIWGGSDKDAEYWARESDMSSALRYLFMMVYAQFLMWQFPSLQPSAIGDQLVGFPSLIRAYSSMLIMSFMAIAHSIIYHVLFKSRLTELLPHLLRGSVGDVGFMPQHLALLNILYTVLYYQLVHNPSGTVQPLWTQILG